MNNEPSVHVVIVTYNGTQWIRECLDSVRRSTYPCTAIVVDNASTDPTREIISNEYKDVIYLPQDKNLGFGAANNIGISKAIASGADFCFLLNQDAFLLPDTISILIKYLLENPAYELASPLHCNPDINRLDPTTQQAYVQRYQSEMVSDACVGQLKECYPIRGINAAAWLVSKNAWLKVGGFDPLFFMYGEDDDLINRFNYHNFNFALIPQARVIHVRGKSPAPTPTWLQSVRRLAIRRRSDLLVGTKTPDDSKASTRLLVLMCDGLLHPTINFLLERNLKTLLANYIATTYLILGIRKILMHARLCRESGPHFLFTQVTSSA